MRTAKPFPPSSDSSAPFREFRESLSPDAFRSGPGRLRRCVRDWEPDARRCSRSKPARQRLERRLGGENTQLLVYSTGTVQRRLMRLATNPAPKPLSIFTTVTFDAQEFNIPSNAAI